MSNNHFQAKYQFGLSRIARLWNQQWFIKDKRRLTGAINEGLSGTS